MKPIRLALVGTGGRGQVYVDVLKRIPSERAVWTVMCDKREDVVAKFCRDNKIDDVPHFDSPCLAAVIR